MTLLFLSVLALSLSSPPSKPAHRGGLMRSSSFILPILLSLSVSLTFTLSHAASPSKIALTGGLLHTSGFILPATVGGVPFRFQVDISQGALSLPGAGCEGCRAGDTRYDVSASSTGAAVACGDATCGRGCVAGSVGDGQHGGCPMCVAGKCCVAPEDAGGGVLAGAEDVCVYNVVYSMGMNGNGTMFRDTFGVGGVEVREMVFGGMRAETESFEVAYADGIMGLGFARAGRRPSVVPAVMEYFTNATGLPGVFSMCTARHGGTLVLGAADESIVRKGEAYKYVPLLDVRKTDKYMVGVLSYGKVGDITVQMPELAAGVWSSATTSIAMGKVTFMAILETMMQHYCHIPGLCSINSWFRPQGCHVISDADLARMPALTFFLAEDVPITLQPEDYLLAYKEVDGKLFRCVAIIVSDLLQSIQVGLMFGSSFMQRYAVAFDFAGRRVGIAPAEQSMCGPTTGSDAGLTVASLGLTLPKSGTVLTAQAAASDVAKIDGPLLSEEFLTSEECRALSDCASCAENQKCSYSYPDGHCLSRVRVSGDGSGGVVYPYCAGRSCICIAVGASGWYVGLVVGIFAGFLCSCCCACFYSRRKRRIRYQTIAPLESTADEM